MRRDIAIKTANLEQTAWNRTWLIVIFLFLISLSLRGGYLVGHGPELGGDTEDYLRLANSISNRGVYAYESVLSLTVSMTSTTPTIRRPPVYPLFLALLGGWDEPSPIVVIITQVILDSLIASLIFIAAKQITGSVISLGAGLLYALNPGAVVACIKIMSESFFTLLLFGSVILIAFGVARNKLVITGLGGAILGASALCRSVALPLPVSFALALLLLPGLNRRKHHIALITFCSVLIIVPWSVRCSLISNSIVFVQGASAIQFYVASRSDLDQKRYAELYDAIFGPDTKDPYGRKVREAKNSAEIVESDRIGFRLALENVKAAPAGYLFSRIRSFPHLFLTSFDDFTGVHASFGELIKNPNWLKLSIKIIFLLIFSAIPFLLAVIGSSKSRTSPIIMLCAVVWIYNWLVHIPMWIEYRFWHPVVPCLLVCSAVGVKKLLSSSVYGHYRQ
jgi:hypothetical protein